MLKISSVNLITGRKPCFGCRFIRRLAGRSDVQNCRQSGIENFSTTIPTKHRLYTLMHNPQYRLSIVWQNVGYNQPPHTDYYLDESIKEVPKPNVVTIKPLNKMDKQ